MEQQQNGVKKNSTLTDDSSPNPDGLELDISYKHPFSIVLSDFLDGMEDLREAIYLSIPSVGKQQVAEIKKLNKEISKYEDSKGELQIPESDPHAASNIMLSVQRFTRVVKSNAVEVLERSLFVGLFSQYDIFIGNLLKALYIHKPELYRNISREISLSDLLEFDNLDAVKNDMLEKEIDSFKRESYIVQFETLEKKFGLPLKKFDEWSEFVELGQRRNLMTHTGGIVSEQYILQCEREGHKFDKRPTVGSKLGLGEPYFLRSINILSKIAFMLVHTLWRKLAPNEFEIADQCLNLNIFNLLTSKNWDLAAQFGYFSLTPAIYKSSKEVEIRIRVINTAIALTQINKTKEAFALLDKFDWSASIREFKLANAILRGKITEACQMMISIGKKGEILEQLAYHQWPLFYKFCDSKEFQETYFLIYGIPFINKTAENTVPTSNIGKEPTPQKPRKILKQ